MSHIRVESVRDETTRDETTRDERVHNECVGDPRRDGPSVLGLVLSLLAGAQIGLGAMTFAAPAHAADGTEPNSAVTIAQSEASSDMDTEDMDTEDMDAEPDPTMEPPTDSAAKPTVTRPLEPRYEPLEPLEKSWYNGSYLFGMTRGVADSTIAPAGKVPLFFLTVPLDIVFLPFAAIGGLFG